MPDRPNVGLAWPAAGQIDVWFFAWDPADSPSSRYRILERYGGAEGPLRVIYRASGQPAVEGRPDLSISLSHSGAVAALAIGRECALGVDLERVRPIAQIDRLARRFFSEDETAAVLRCPEPERLFAFFRTWVRKEAYLKGLGGGVPSRLRSFAVLEEPDGSLSIPFTRLESEPVSAWSLVDLAAPGGYVAALAADREIEGARIRKEEGLKA